MEMNSVEMTGFAPPRPNTMGRTDYKFDLEKCDRTVLEGIKQRATPGKFFLLVFILCVLD